MRTAKDILYSKAQENGDGFTAGQVKWIVEAMEEYKKQQSAHWQKIVSDLKEDFCAAMNPARHISNEDVEYVTKAFRDLKWISVEERLPEQHLVVLVYVPLDEFGLRTLGYYVNGHWYQGITKITTKFENDVTHWQELPPPPTKK